jgi:hypothetical protein
MPVPMGTINPVTGHINEDDVALFRAIGPDQADCYASLSVVRLGLV